MELVVFSCPLISVQQTVDISVENSNIRCSFIRAASLAVNQVTKSLSHKSLFSPKIPFYFDLDRFLLCFCINQIYKIVLKLFSGNIDLFIGADSLEEVFPVRKFDLLTVVLL